MSSHHRNAAPQPPPSGPCPFLVSHHMEGFQEAARALLEACEQAAPPAEPAVSCQPRPGGEIRCYYFPPGAVQGERELLKKYRVRDVQGLVTHTRLLLAGVVKLMKSAHPDARVKGRAIAGLGCLLEQVSSLLARMENVYSRVEKTGP